MPQDVKSDHGASAEPSPQGLTAEASDPVALKRAIEMAVDYRGDVTVTRRSTGESIECYIFDLRRRGDDEAVVRILPHEGPKQSIPLSDIAQVRFTGRDTAAGKSFETWMRKYVEKKLAGERASIESDPLE